MSNRYKNTDNKNIEDFKKEVRKYFGEYLKLIWREKECKLSVNELFKDFEYPYETNNYYSVENGERAMPFHLLVHLRKHGLDLNAAVDYIIANMTTKE